MQSMGQRRDDILGRFVHNLSAKSQQGIYSPVHTPLHYGLAEIPIALDPLSLCSYTLPSLSLSSECDYPAAGLSHIHLCSRQPSSSPQEQLHREQRIKCLLSREFHCNTVSVASYAMLRNFVASFGTILQLELERKLYNLIEKLEQRDDDTSTQDDRTRKKEAIYKAFEEQALTDEPPVVPVSSSTLFYPTSMNDHPASAHTEGNLNVNVSPPSMNILFEAKIRLHLNPRCVTETSRITAPGEIRMNVQSQNNGLESITLTLDMDVLYRAIVKECKHVTKLILNGIMGCNNFDRAWKPSKTTRIRDDTRVSENNHDYAHEKTNKKSKPMGKLTYIPRSDSVTNSTVATSDDNSVEGLRRRNKMFVKRHVSNFHAGGGSSPTHQTISDQSSEESIPDYNRVRNPSKKKILKWLVNIPARKHESKVAHDALHF